MTGNRSMSSSPPIPLRPPTGSRSIPPKSGLNSMGRYRVSPPFLQRKGVTKPLRTQGSRWCTPLRPPHPDMYFRGLVAASRVLARRRFSPTRTSELLGCGGGRRAQFLLLPNGLQSINSYTFLRILIHFVSNILQDSGVFSIWTQRNSTNFLVCERKMIVFWRIPQFVTPNRVS